MSRSLALPLAPLVLIGLGCVEAQQAPPELVDPTFFFFSAFETATDEEAAETLLLVEAETWAQVDLEGERTQREWQPPPLLAEHLGGAQAPPGVDPNLQVTIAVAGRSTQPVSAHEAGVLLEDQSVLEPSAPSHVRSYPDGTACWADGECARIDTVNEVSKSNILYTIDYTTEKDFRRLTLPDGRAAMFARTWNDSVASGEGGVNSIDQNYATDLFLEDPDDPSATLRLMTIWTSVTLAANPEDTAVRVIIARGIDDLFARHDAVYSEEE